MPHERPDTRGDCGRLGRAAAAHARLPAALIARDLPDTKGATIVEVDEHELEGGEAEFDGERLAIIVLDTGHMYGLSFVPRPLGALLH